jgi:hypothetical protein
MNCTEANTLSVTTQSPFADFRPSLVGIQPPLANFKLVISYKSRRPLLLEMRLSEFFSRFPNATGRKHIKLRGKKHLELENTPEPSFSITTSKARITLLEMRLVNPERSFERSVAAALKHLYDLSRDDSQRLVDTNNDKDTQISTSEKDDIIADSSSSSDVTDSRYSSEVEQDTSKSLSLLQVIAINMEIPSSFRPPCSSLQDVHGYRVSRFCEHLNLDDVEWKPTQRSRSVPADAIRFHSPPKPGQSRRNFGWMKRKESKQA